MNFFTYSLVKLILVRCVVQWISVWLLILIVFVIGKFLNEMHRSVAETTINLLFCIISICLFYFNLFIIDLIVYKFIVIMMSWSSPPISINLMSCQSIPGEVWSCYIQMFWVCCGQVFVQWHFSSLHKPQSWILFKNPEDFAYCAEFFANMNSTVNEEGKEFWICWLL